MGEQLEHADAKIGRSFLNRRFHNSGNPHSRVKKIVGFAAAIVACGSPRTTQDYVNWMDTEEEPLE